MMMQKVKPFFNMPPLEFFRLVRPKRLPKSSWRQPPCGMKLFVAQELVNKVKAKYCGIKDYLFMLLLL